MILRCDPACISHAGVVSDKAKPSDLAGNIDLLFAMECGGQSRLRRRPRFGYGHTLHNTIQSAVAADQACLDPICRRSPKAAIANSGFFLLDWIVEGGLLS